METFALVMVAAGLTLAAYALTSWLAVALPSDPVRLEASRGIRELEAYLALEAARRG